MQNTFTRHTCTHRRCGVARAYSPEAIPHLTRRLLRRRVRLLAMTYYFGYAYTSRLNALNHKGHRVHGEKTRSKSLWLSVLRGKYCTKPTQLATPSFFSKVNLAIACRICYFICLRRAGFFTSLVGTGAGIGSNSVRARRTAKRTIATIP